MNTGKWKVRSFYEVLGEDMEELGYDPDEVESSVYVTREGYMEDSEGWEEVDNRYCLFDGNGGKDDYLLAVKHAVLFAVALNHNSEGK